MISIILQLVLLPFFENFFIFALGISPFSISVLLFSLGERKYVEYIGLFLISLILDVTCNYKLGTYMISLSLALLVYRLFRKIFSPANIMYSFTSLMIYFLVFFFVKQLLFFSQNDGGLKFGESSAYIYLLSVSIFSSLIFSLIDYFVKQIRGDSDMLKLK